MTRPHKLLTALLIAAVVLVIYYPVTTGQFVFDDRKLVSENQELWEGAGFDLNVFEDRSEDEVRINFRPIRFASYKVDVLLTRAFSDVDPPNEDPYWFHLHNILLHALNAVLVFLIVGRVLPDVHWGVAPFAALAFALHPAQTESVAYISGRRDVLFLCFYLIAAYLYVRHRGRAGWGTGAALAFLFILSLLTKEMAFSLPVVLLALELLAPTPSGGRNWKRITFGFVGLYVIGGLLVLGLLWTANPGGGVGLWGGSRLNATISALRAIAHYVGVLVWPTSLTIDYSFNAFPASDGWASPAGGLPALFLFVALAVTACAALTSGTRSGRWIAVGLGVFLVTLLPVLQILPHPERLAERFLYLPLLGFLMVIGGFVAPLVRSSPVPSVAVGLVVLGLWGSATSERLEAWQSRYALWKSAVEVHPECARAQFALGEAARELGRDPEAVLRFSRAVDLLAPIPERTPLQHGYYLQALKLRSQVRARSTDEGTVRAARQDLEALLEEFDTGAEYPLSEEPLQLIELLKLNLRLGESERSLQVAEAILALPDERFDSAGAQRVRLEAALTVAGLRAESGDSEGAEQMLNQAESLATTPRQKARVQFDRGVHYRNSERWQLAADCFARVQELYEGGDRVVSAMYYAAECADRLRRPQQARELLEKLLEQYPDHTPTLLSLGDLCVRQKELDAAQRHYTRLLELAPQETRAVDGLRNIAIQKQLAQQEEASVRTRRALPLLLLGERKYAEGAPEDAEKALVEADRHAEGPEHLPHRHRARRLYARIAVERGDLDEAHERYEAYLALEPLEDDPFRAQTLSEVAEVRRRRGDTNAAIELLESEWKRGVEDAALAMNAATMLVELREAAGAIRWYRRALAVEGLSSAKKEHVRGMIRKLEPLLPKSEGTKTEEGSP